MIEPTGQHLIDGDWVSSDAKFTSTPLTGPGVEVSEGTAAEVDRAAKAAEATAREVFEKGGVGDDLPTLALNKAELGDGISIVQLLVRSGLANSGKEAKRLISDNGAKIDDKPLTNAGLMLDAAALASPVKLSAGKKRHALITLET